MSRDDAPCRRRLLRLERSASPSSDAGAATGSRGRCTTVSVSPQNPPSPAELARVPEVLEALVLGSSQRQGLTRSSALLRASAQPLPSERGSPRSWSRGDCWRDSEITATSAASGWRPRRPRRQDGCTPSTRAPGRRETPSGRRSSRRRPSCYRDTRPRRSRSGRRAAYWEGMLVGGALRDDLCAARRAAAGRLDGHRWSRWRFLRSVGSVQPALPEPVSGDLPEAGRARGATATDSVSPRCGCSARSSSRHC